MDQGKISTENDLDLPASFFDAIIRDIPVSIWARFLQTNMALKAAVFEGFSTRPSKIEGLLKQSHIVSRLRRYLRADIELMNSVLKVWGQEELVTMSFLEMLDRTFLLDNWESLKNFVGPERFFAGVYLLGYVQDEEFRNKIDMDFWERRVGQEVIDPLIPVLELWHEFSKRFPDSMLWVGEVRAEAAEEEDSHKRVNTIDLEESGREEYRRNKLEEKLNQAIAKQEKLQQDVLRYRKENEELRKSISEKDRTFDETLRTTLEHLRMQWFQRYREVEVGPLEEHSRRLDSVFKRAEHAFELQRKSDERYGLIAEVRQKLMRVEQYLKEIERIYADSLVVHSDVTKAKDALLRERSLLLALPGIEKILKREPHLVLSDNIRQKLRLMEPLPESLAKINQLLELVSRLSTLGIIENSQTLVEDILHKKRQILEVIYACFQPHGKGASSIGNLTDFDDFVRSGLSRKYDVYVDGYNILLKVQGNRSSNVPFSLAEFRDEFIRAVSSKSRLFRRVCIVFDGTGHFRDREGNMEVVFTDKSRGVTADEFIIQDLQKRKDQRAILVTADQEIIRATENRVFAMLAPYDFYAFVFDTTFPERMDDHRE